MTSEEFLRWARVLPEPFCLVSGDGKVVACNPPAAALFGLPSEALRERPLFELTTDPIEKVKDYVRLCSSSNEMCLGSLTLRSQAGEFETYRCEGALLRPRTGDTPSLILLRFKPRVSASNKFLLLNEKIDALAKEIHVRRRAEEEALAQREWFRVTLASIGDAVIATDAQGHITFMNPVAQALTGWHVDEAFGKPLHEVFHIVNEQTREIVENPVTKVFREGTIVGLANHTLLIAKDNTERPINDSAAPIKDESGKIIGTVLVFHDVTERRQAEVRLQQALEREHSARLQAEEANQLKDEFLATVSHELRTPLNAILGWVRMLRGGKLDAATSARALATIERNARSQNTLIEDILDVSRIITGRLRLQPETMDVLPVIEAALDSIRPTAEAKGVRLETRLEPDTGCISGDPQRIQQIVWNLLSNAIKFTPKGGQVELHLARTNSQIEITITDTGIGIRPDFLPYVFDRFRQADSSSTRVYGGLGLGLAIVRHLVELHGGKVSAESRGEGQGATFKVILPVAVFRQELNPLYIPPQPQDMKDQEATAINLAGLRLLIVDDDETARELLTVALTQSGAEVQAAASVADALNLLNASLPDLLVSDIGMPVEDGYALIKKVRARAPERGGAIPAVALTAYAKSEDRLRALAAGYQMHIAKPVDPIELTTVIASLAGRLHGKPIKM
ncbi:MAG TPA: ATP-binding protein [Blastocatellia bacterium]|nr:ATP-binding protein [Blastocatellia bacterium]